MKIAQSYVCTCAHNAKACLHECIHQIQGARWAIDRPQPACAIENEHISHKLLDLECVHTAHIYKQKRAKTQRAHRTYRFQVVGCFSISHFSIPQTENQGHLNIRLNICEAQPIVITYKAQRRISQIYI